MRFEEYRKKFLEKADGFLFGPGLPATKVGTGPIILITGTIHGNEPAPIYLYKFLPKNATNTLLFVPILNPIGFNNRTRTKNGKDLNRDFKNDPSSPETKAIINLVYQSQPKLLLTLHEDKSIDAFYCYCDNQKIAKKICFLAKKFFPLANGDIHGDNAKDGIIKKLANTPKNKYSLEGYVDKLKIPVITIETPSNDDIKNRVKFLKKLINYFAYTNLG